MRYNKLILIKLIIFSYNILFLFSLFLLSYNTNRRFNFIKKKLFLLRALKKKLKEKKDLISKDTKFLKDL